MTTRWRQFVSNDLNKERTWPWQKSPVSSHDRKTALSSDVIVTRRQVLIEGTVRFTFPRRDRTSVSRWTSEPREGLVVDRAKVVTLFPSYDKTTLSIGLVPGFEPATYRSYATKLTPPVDSAACKIRFSNLSGIIYDLWRKNYLYLFFSLIRRCIFFSMNVFLIALVIISGCVLQPSIFGGGDGRVGNRLSSCSMFWWRRKEMWAGKTAWRHAALPYLNAWNLQASYHVKISIQGYDW